MNIAIAIGLFCSLLVGAVDATGNIRGTEQNDVLCLVIKAHQTGQDGHHEFFTCDLILEKEVAVNVGLLIELPKHVINENTEALHRGEWYVRITGATIKETFIEGHGMIRTSVYVPPGANFVTVSPEDGKMAMSSALGTVAASSAVSGERRLLNNGVHTLMVIRVSVSDSTPTFTTSQLTSDYFDVNSYSLVRQYTWCSFGAIQFVPYDASNPVVDVLILGNAANFTKDTLRTLALNAVAAQKRVSSVNNIAMHVAVVLPPRLADSVPTWYAIGQVGGWWTEYNDMWGGYPEFAMHELGHNLGMGHAGVGADEYADQSDIMGYGDTQQFGITKCFNGYHYSFLQWFASRSLTVNAYAQNLVTLAAFPDFNLTSASQSVIVNVDSYYLIYNRKKGINGGVNDAIDKVTVAQAQANMFSLRVAVLDSTTGAFQIANYGGGTQPLTIQVCSNTKGNLVDYAVVSIGIGAANCTSGLTNSQITPAPTKTPTSSPTKQPTMKPTFRPTPIPTTKPTGSPTPLPTRRPSKAPTLSPSRKPSVQPTRSPSRKPTRLPTRSPTQKPTAKPSFGPTGKPTKIPTLQPTQKPTRSPTSKPTKPPTPLPTQKPTVGKPSSPPTSSPSPKPSKQPTSFPTGKPTNSPTQATLSPTVYRPPTDAPVNPTSAPVTSTDVPASPTVSPVAPTESPLASTPSPVASTTAPVSPTTQPVTLSPTPRNSASSVGSRGLITKYR